MSVRSSGAVMALLNVLRVFFGLLDLENQSRWSARLKENLPAFWLLCAAVEAHPASEPFFVSLIPTQTRLLSSFQNRCQLLGPKKSIKTSNQK